MNLFPNLTVAETILIGREPLRAGIDIDTTAQAQATRAQMMRLEQDTALDTPLDHLRVGQQQVVEFANSLSQDARIPILDEPTSALSAADAEVLVRTMRDLAARGLRIHFVTSDPDEVLAYFSVMAPKLLSAANAVIVSKHVARNALLSISRTFVIITGAIDPSVGSIVGHCAMVAGWLVLNGVDTWLGYTIWVNSVEIVAITLAVGVDVGLIMSGVSSFWQTVIKGVGIVLALVIGPAKSRLQARVAHAQEAAVRR